MPALYSSEDALKVKDCLKACISSYDEKYESDLRVAFNKFDKDGSGSIDKEELADLS
ncbi:MAG: hypothetical protein ACKO96_13860, partial [Flammeovirgaceae bacterium]